MSEQRVVVVVSGNMHHGKDTLADLLAGMIPNSRRDSFAHSLKLCVSLMTGIPMEILNGPASVKNDARFGRYDMSPRKLMQDVGEWAREGIARTIWRDRTAERCLGASERVTIISDGRHPIEEISGMRDYMAEAGGHRVFAVRVVRPDTPLLLGHPSEDNIAAVSDGVFDFKVVNDAPREINEAHPEFESHFQAFSTKARQLADAIVSCVEGAPFESDKFDQIIILSTRSSR